MSLLNRIILRELFKIFMMALVAITCILVLTVVVIEAQHQGLGPMQIIAIVPLIVPSTLPYTIPATTLFATCIVYGRLAADNEILAIKTAGINVFTIIKPALFLGVLMSLTTAGLYYHVIPTTYHTMKTVFLSDLERLIYSILRRKGSFTHPKMDFEIYVQRVEGKKLIEAEFKHKDPDDENQFDVVARAREAEILVDNVQRKIIIHMRHCRVTSNGGDGGTGYLQDKFWPVDFPPNFVEDRKSRRSDMTWPEIEDKLIELEDDIEDKDDKIALTAALVGLGKSPDGLAVHLRNLRSDRNIAQMQIYNLRGELHRRIAIGFGCLCFVLVGCPVGIWFSRSDYLSAFVTCFLPIVLIYYPLIICGDNLAKSGKMEPTLALWLANGLMVFIAVGLYWKLMKN